MSVFANMCGAFLSFVVAWMRRDPAIIVAPMMTTILDTVGILLYFLMAIALLGPQRLYSNSTDHVDP